MALAAVRDLRAPADEEELAEGMPPLEAQIDPAQAEEAAESVAANPAGDANP